MTSSPPATSRTTRMSTRLSVRPSIANAAEGEVPTQPATTRATGNNKKRVQTEREPAPIESHKASTSSTSTEIVASKVPPPPKCAKVMATVAAAAAAASTLLATPPVSQGMQTPKTSKSSSSTTTATTTTAASTAAFEFIPPSKPPSAYCNGPSSVLPATPPENNKTEHCATPSTVIRNGQFVPRNGDRQAQRQATTEASRKGAVKDIIFKIDSNTTAMQKVEDTSPPNVVTLPKNSTAHPLSRQTSTPPVNAKPTTASIVTVAAAAIMVATSSSNVSTEMPPTPVTNNAKSVDVLQSLAQTPTDKDSSYFAAKKDVIFTDWLLCELVSFSYYFGLTDNRVDIRVVRLVAGGDEVIGLSFSLPSMT